jgi:hypothetical protein
MEESDDSRSVVKPITPEYTSKSIQGFIEKTEFSCQVVRGRDIRESRSSLRNDKSEALDPYKQDVQLDPYKRDGGTQFRASQKTVSQETANRGGRHKLLQVSEDLTIQLKFNKDTNPRISTLGELLFNLILHFRRYRI